MTLTQLKYFNAVCQFKNVTNAANELHVSQPSISNAIRELEDELGIQLFHRIKMRLILTKEGEFFLLESSKILADIEKLGQHMRNLGEKHNLIQIGIPPMIGTLLFPQIMLAFCRNYPDIKIEVEECGSLLCRQKILEESLDLAIVITNDIDKNKFNVLPLMETELQFCVEKKHPLASCDFVTIEDIKDYPIVLLPEGSYNRAQAMAFYKRNGLAPNILLHSSQLYTIEQLLYHSDTGAFLFREFARHSSNVIGIPISPPLDPVHVGICWKKNRYLYADVIQFVNFARNLSSGGKL